MRAAENQYQLPHSGYDESLADGGFAGNDSDGPGEAPFSDMIGRHSAASPSLITDLGTLNIPHHFREYPLRRAHMATPADNLPHGAGDNSTAAFLPAPSLTALDAECDSRIFTCHPQLKLRPPPHRLSPITRRSSTLSWAISVMNKRPLRAIFLSTLSCRHWRI